MVLIGCGRIAHAYATVIDGHRDMELEAVVDVNEEAAYAFGTAFHCDYYTSLDNFLAGNGQSECGVICTPPCDHAEIACRLMKEGLNVLCEKPFALDSVSATKMVETSRKSGVLLMMGSKYRYVADIIHARGLIQAGILGQVLVFESDFRELADMRNRWNVQPAKSGGGVLIDSGSHAVDVAQYLFGPIARVHAEEASRIQSEDVDDTVRLALRTVSGVVGTINLSWTIKNAGDDFIRVYGTQGTLCIGWQNSKYRPSGAREWINFGEGYSKLKAIMRQMVNFVDVITKDAVPEVTVDDSLDSVRVIEAAYRSLETGQWQNLSPATPAIRPAVGERKFFVVHS